MSDLLGRLKHFGAGGTVENPVALIRDVVAEMERLYADRRLGGQANLLLARIIAAANLGAINGADGFVESYNLPVGPIHKAIPFLQEQGIVVTADGQILNGPEQRPMSRNLSDLVARARYSRECGNFDSLHGELLDMVEAERDRAAEHFDALMDLRTRFCGAEAAYCECAKTNGHPGPHRCRECGTWPG